MFTYTVPTHTLTTTVSPSGAGTVTSGGSMAEGATKSLTATANSGYTFDHWTVSGTGASLSSTTANPTTFTMGTANATVTAYFTAAEPTAATIPYTCNFENSTERSNWTAGFGNNGTNNWYVGTAAYSSSSYGMYITNDGGSSNAYTTTTTQYSYAKRKVTFSTTGDYQFTFKWKCTGEGNWDNLRAFLAPTTATLTGGTTNGMSGNSNPTPSGWIDVSQAGGPMNNQSSWQTSTKSVNVTSGTYYLVFFWKNDDSQGTDPAAVDDISITVAPPSNSTCATATNLPCGTSGLAGTTVGTPGTAHGLPSSASLSNYGVWYTFTGDGSRTTVSVHATGYDSEIAIVSGSCGNFSWIGYNDSGNSTESNDTYTFNTESGTTYYVYVAYYSTSGSSSDTGTFTISRTCEATNHTITLTQWPTSPSATLSGAGTFAEGSNRTITAMAPSGYQFVNWTGSDGNVVSHNASYTFTLSGDVTYQANFTKTTATALPWTDGFEGYSSAQLLNGEWATPLRYGELPRVVTHNPTSGTYSLEVRQDHGNYCMVVLPQFDQPLNTLVLSFNYKHGNHSSGYNVQLVAITDLNNPTSSSSYTVIKEICTSSQTISNYTSTSNPYTIRLYECPNAPSSSTPRLAIRYSETSSDGDSWYMDNFKVAASHTLTMESSPTAGGSATVGSTTIVEGGTTTITATPNIGYVFTGWTVSGTGASVADDSSPSTTFTMGTTNATVTANFEELGVFITSTPASTGCLTSGTEVVLTASTNAPFSSYTFTQTTETFSSISGSPGGTSTNTGDAATFAFELPFDFNLAGKDLPSGTTVTMRCDGHVSIGSYYNAHGPSSPGTTYTVISPLGYDQNLNSGESYMYYKVTTENEARVLTMEWKNMRSYYSTNSAYNWANYQVKLYEGSNIVKLCYGSFTYNYSCSIYTYLTADGKMTKLTGSYANPAMESNTTGGTTLISVNSASTAPANGTVYIFDPNHYTWTYTGTAGTADGNTYTVSPTQNSTYTVSLTIDGQTYTETASVTVKPAVPTDLTANNITSTTATVTWNANGASSWKYSINNGSTWTDVNANSVNLTGLTPGQSYIFQVKAVSGDCESSAASVQFTTLVSYIIHLASTTNGTVTSPTDGSTAYAGATITVATTPSTDYHLSALYYTTESAPSTHVNISGNSFTMPADNVTIYATFASNDLHYVQSGNNVYMSWDEFVTSVVNNSQTYSGKTIYLDRNITINSIVNNHSLWTTSKAFWGTFDGQCHTITLDITATQDFTGLFCYTYGATIKDLKLEGTITSSYPNTASFIGMAQSTTHIENCISNVTINSTAAGVAGMVAGVVNKVYFSGCAFTGTLNGSSTSDNGGFVGKKWYDETHSYTNCLFAPTSVSSSLTNGYTFDVYTSSSFTNCYYTEAYGTAQGKQARVVSAGTDVTVTKAGTPTQYSCSGIDAYSPGMVYDLDNDGTGDIIGGDGDVLTLSLSYSGSLVLNGYTATTGTLSNGTHTGTNDAYTLTMTNSDAIINADCGFTVTAVAEPAGSGTFTFTGDVTSSTANPAQVTPNGDVTITANANRGYTFMYWKDESDAVVSTTNPYTLEDVSSDRTVTAHFVDMTASNTWPAVVTNISAATPGYSESSGDVTISNEEGLAWFISKVNGLNSQAPSTFETSTITLTADVDMSAHIWVPIGTKENPFQGTFEGNGHVIKGITRSEEFPHNGLFGYVSGTANIKDVVVEASLTGNSIATGAVVGTYDGTGTISNAEGAGTLTGGALTTAIGGLVGNMTDGSIHSSFAVATLTGGASSTQMGGLVGTNAGDLYNSYSNATYAGTSATKGGLVGANTGTVENCYAAGIVSGVSALAGSNSGGTIQYCYSDAVGAGYVGTNATAPSGCGTYGAVQSSIKHLNYMYRDNLITKSTNTYVGSNDAIADGISVYVNNHIPVWNGLVSALNQWVRANPRNISGLSSWQRPLTTNINGDLPVLAFPMDNSLGTLDTDGKFLQYGSNQNGGNGLDAVLNTFSGTTASIFHYGKATGVTRVPTANVNVFIAEDAVLLQASGASAFRATVGVTFDNSDHGQHAYDYWGNKLNYDWHLLSTPLYRPLTGAVHSTDQPSGNPWSNVDITNIGGYFPNGLITNDNPAVGGSIKWDFYTYYEPQYHWINLKRNKNNHYHQDSPNDIIIYNEPDQDTDGESAYYIPGKGYEMAINQDTYMNATGTLNRGDVPITLTNQEPASEQYAKGWNLVGNPYQAYLDIDEIGYDPIYTYDADQGTFVPYTKTASVNPAIVSEFIHPHQAFFVHAKTGETTETLTFTQDMATTSSEAGSYFREKNNYPLVNLFADDDVGHRDLTVIEFHRPELGGAPKLDYMRTAPFNLAAHYAGTSYGIFFATDNIERVPVKFKPSDNGLITLTWSTHNGEFRKLLLIDNKLGVEHNMLADNSYSFEASPDDYSSRFYIVYDCSGMGIEENEDDSGALTGSATFAYISHGNIVIDVGTSHGASLQIIDVLGRVLYSKTMAGTEGTYTISTRGLAKGVYLIRLADGHNVKTQKLVVQ